MVITIEVEGGFVLQFASKIKLFMPFAAYDALCENMRHIIRCQFWKRDDTYREKDLEELDRMAGYIKKGAEVLSVRRRKGTWSIFIIEIEVSEALIKTNDHTDMYTSS